MRWDIFLKLMRGLSGILGLNGSGKTTLSDLIAEAIYLQRSDSY